MRSVVELPLAVSWSRGRRMLARIGSPASTTSRIGCDAVTGSRPLRPKRDGARRSRIGLRRTKAQDKAASEGASCIRPQHGSDAVALFQKTIDPLRKAQRDLEAACATRDGLLSRRKAAEVAVGEHRERARKLARDGADDAALSAAESAMRTQQDRTATLSAAISDVEATIAG